jgi:hypothetical protein
MAAVMKGHEATVHLLLQAGAAVAHKNKNGDSAIRSLPKASLHAYLPHPVWFKPGVRNADVHFSVGVSSAFSALPALLDAVASSDTALLLQPNAKNVSPLHAACSLSSPLSAVVVPQVFFSAYSAIRDGNSRHHPRPK